MSDRTPAPAERSRIGPRVAVLVMVVLAVLAYGTAGWFGISWYRAAHDEELELATTRDTVLRQAQQAAVNLNTLDYQRVEEGLELWARSSTGQVLDEFRKNRDLYAKTIRDARTATDATVLDGAVAELDMRSATARVLVAVDVTVTPQQGQPSVNRQRLQLQMNRTEQGWKVSAIGPVGAES